MDFSRRRFFHFAGAGAGLLLQSKVLNGLTSSEVDSGKSTPSSAKGSTPVASPRTQVALVKGENRRKNIEQALLTIDKQVQAGLKGKKYVIIKPNNVSTENQLASTHIDAIYGVLDYLAPRFRGPVVVAESSAGDTLEGFESFGYHALEKDKSQKVTLVDLNREDKYESVTILDFDLHIAPVRLAARLFDPDAYVICCAILKSHNAAIASLSVKNMVLGAPLHGPNGWRSWNDKRKYHAGIRQMHYNMLVTAEKMRPHWGVAVIDGFEGMEGNGPTQGVPVQSRIAIASTDFLAADRVGLETMGVDPEWPGYLTYCAKVGLGQYDLSKIEVVGPPIASVQKKYRLHNDVERQLQWRGPMEDLPPRMGRLMDEQSFKYV